MACIITDKGPHSKGHCIQLSMGWVIDTNYW